MQDDLKINYKNPIDDGILHLYIIYFKKWNKTYPIEYQLRSIHKGKDLPNVSVLVDSMFYAELQNRILISGHDLDKIIGTMEFDLTTGNEQFTKIERNGCFFKKRYNRKWELLL